MAKKKQIDKQFKIDAVNYRKNHPELTMAEVANNLGISLSSIHRWIRKYSSNSDDESKVFRGSGEIYGAPKITYILRQKGIKISMKTVSNYMREMGIKAYYIKHWTKTTVSKNFSSDLKNLLKREFNPDRPNAFWCTDITYIWTMMRVLFI